MGELVQMEDRQPHLAGEARCLQCGHTWAAVAPSGVPLLECPSCHTLKGAWIGPVVPPDGEEVWQCQCGADLFWVSRNGVRCPRCGLAQVFP